MRLKPIAEQVIVITGATSGIGLATARLACRKGAAVVLASRDEQALRQLADELSGKGGRAYWVCADVGNRHDVRKIADAARNAFGGFDTWVNNAGVTIYGRMNDTPLEDARRLFDTNFWGVVSGSLEAAEEFRRRDGEFAGAIINIGSILSDVSIPLQGIYSASKHAVKGFTDSLRMELEHDGVQAVVTLVKPSAIDTPYTRHARNFMDREPDVPPPVYAPETVAHAILQCASHPMRDITVGSGGKVLTAIGNAMPRVTDKVFESVLYNLQKKREPRGDHGDALYSPGGGLSERGDYRGLVRKHSFYTTARTHPGVAALAVLGIGFLLTMLLSQSGSRQSGPAHRARPRSMAVRGSRY